MIAHMPELGQLYPFRHPAMQNARIRKIKKFSNYLIFYRIETDRIEILRVLHGATDYMNLFDAVLAEE
jgi:plasmid stabilization system protein ParE